MNSFSKLSEARLITCHDDLQVVFCEVIKEIDCTVLCGTRGEDEQEEAFRLGRSKVHWPDSLHNRTPSLAIDVVPYPVDWNDIRRFARFAGYVERVAWEKSVPLRWGGDFNGDWRSNDKFVDMPHFELVLSRS